MKTRKKNREVKEGNRKVRNLLFINNPNFWIEGFLKNKYNWKKFILPMKNGGEDNNGED